MGYGLQHLFPAFLHRTWYVDFLSGWSHGGGKITKHHKKADSLPPPSPVAQQIQFGNPHSLLVLINRLSLAIFLLVNSFFTYVRFICVLLILWSNFYLTGLINLTIHTMYTSNVWAMILLVVYLLSLCGVPRIFLWLLFRREDEAINGGWLSMLLFFFIGIFIWIGPLWIMFLAVIKGLFRFWTLLCMAVPWLTRGIDLPSFSHHLTCYTLPEVGWHSPQMF